MTRVVWAWGAQNVYLAGPMSSVKDFNFPTFADAARVLRDCGYKVSNPAENHDGRTDLPLADYLKVDLPQVCEADAVVVLPGWRLSKGASIEVSLAQYLSKPVYDYTTLDDETGKMDTIYETAAQEAQRLVHGDRGVAYGHPLDDLGRTAGMWSAMFGFPVTAEMVGLGMIAVKASRIMAGLQRGGQAHRDSVVDIAGYAEVIEMVRLRREEQA